MRFRGRVRGRIPAPIKTGRLGVNTLSRDIAKDIRAAMIQQIPSHTGETRRSVRHWREGGGYKVAPTIKRAVWLEVGTGRWYNSPFDFGKRGGESRTRSARYTEDEIAMFKAIRKRGGIISSPPNKFTQRTVNEDAPKILRDAGDKVRREFRRSVRI